MRVLVASRGPSLATVVESAGHEVIDARPGDAAGWSANEPAPACEAVLLDLDSAEASAQAIEHLTQAQPSVRVVVIRGVSDDWATFDNPGDALVVSPPFTREALIAALEHVDRHENPPPATPPTQTTARDESAPILHAADLPQPNERDITDCVTRLLRAADDLLDVREVADAVAALTAERIGAEACALALPDGPVWRVTGGYRLRPVEGRMLIPPEHWLTADLLAAKRGAVIEHTDITRAQLRQAPLASMDYLVIATDRSNGAILMAGHETRAFTKDDLATLQHTLREANAIVREALELRDLARALQRFTDSG